MPQRDHEHFVRNGGSALGSVARRQIAYSLLFSDLIVARVRLNDQGLPPVDPDGSARDMVSEITHQERG